MHTGYLALVLHAHLPFVRHPEYEDSFEEEWLFEAITETYLPLLEAFDRLLNDRVPFRITMSITPPLAAMLQDRLLQQRYQRHLERLIELAGRERLRTAGTPQTADLARHYQETFTRSLHLFRDVHGGDLTRGFRQVMETGSLEIVTCGATHGFLPLMRTVPEAVRAQVRVATASHEACFGRPPRGIWLPECGYYPGVGRFLAEAGILFTFLDAHGVLNGRPGPRYGTFAPVLTPEGVAAFGRDQETTTAVWSAEEGYPGHPDYREFYKDIGFDLDLDYIRPYIHPLGIRKNTGIKYHRITGKVPLEKKGFYSWERAYARAREHAGNFVFNRTRQVEHRAGLIDRRPLVVSMYDAELFGHWWYEGPHFIEQIARTVHHDAKPLRLTTPAEYLDEYPENQMTSPAASSWGYRGHNEFWLNPANDWVYRHLIAAARRMVGLADRFRTPSDLERRALNQAARELLLAQSSDWAFIMRTGTVADYAAKRTVQHLDRFRRLADRLEGGGVDGAELSRIETKDTIFPGIDYAVYRREANTR